MRSRILGHVASSGSGWGPTLVGNFMKGAGVLESYIPWLDDVASYLAFRENVFMDEIVIGYRNGVLAEEIIASGENKIFVVYGSEHFQGVYDILKSEDRQWRIVGKVNSWP